MSLSITCITPCPPCFHTLIGEPENLSPGDGHATGGLRCPAGLSLPSFPSKPAFRRRRSRILHLEHVFLTRATKRLLVWFSLYQDPTHRSFLASFSVRSPARDAAETSHTRGLLQHRADDRRPFRTGGNFGSTARITPLNPFLMVVSVLSLPIAGDRTCPRASCSLRRIGIFARWQEHSSGEGSHVFSPAFPRTTMLRQELIKKLLSLKRFADGVRCVERLTAIIRIHIRLFVPTSMLLVAARLSP
jgi:hypothetical protein